ncbi:hypothetical protein [Fusobacterium necrogenes]|nr:hypothetical protein [Fusobacterium necrogenes]
MKKIFFIFILFSIFVACSSTDKNFKKIKIVESEPQYILEEIK